MIKENENFIVEFDENINYIDDLISILEKEMQRILNFFGITRLDKKKKIKIWNNRAEYQLYLEQYVSQYYDWMIADTHDGNINMLSIEECKKTKSHSDITMQFFLQSIVHEFVHSCQQEINSDATNVEWFWEALATNLGNPFDHVTSIQYNKEELMYKFDSLSYNYNTAYTIGKFMIEKIPHNQILEYVRSPQKLINDTDKIIDSARQWFNEKYLVLPTIPKAENENFVIYSSDTLSELANDTLIELSNNRQRILSFFGLSDYRKVEVNLYDNQDDFIKFLKNVRPLEWLIPDYCQGTFDDYMINHSIDLNELNSKYSSYLKSSLHEFIHIIYNDAVADERIIWLDEGLAMNLSGEHNFYDDDEKFKNFFQTSILSIKIFPSMNDLIHGKIFVNDDYNGYNLSYFVVRYMLESMSYEDILSTIKESKKVKLLGQNILNDAIQYYSKKFELSPSSKKL